MTDINRLVKRARRSEQFSLVVTLVVVFLLLWLLNGTKFVTVRNLRSMSYQLPIIGLLAIGMMVSELFGGIKPFHHRQREPERCGDLPGPECITGGSMQDANIDASVHRNQRRVRE